MAAVQATTRGALKSLDTLPGPIRLFMLTAGANVTQRIHELGVRHPRMFKLWLGRPVLVASHPEVARQIILCPDLEKRHFVTFSKYVQPILKTLPEAMLFDNGEDWVATRKPLDPAFDKKALAMLVPKYAEMSRKLLDSWSEASVVDAKRDMSRFALDVLGATILGRSFGALEGSFDDTYKHYKNVMVDMVNPLYAAFPSLELLPTARNRRLRDGLLHMRGFLQDTVDARLEQRRQAGDFGEAFAPKDMLDMVLGPGIDAKGVVPEERLLGTLWIMFIGGHETTATALTWLMKALAENPHVQDRARTEALAILDGAEDPTPEMLDNVPYISAVINESMRLRPPIFNVLTRAASRDTEIDGVHVPKGTAVSVLCSAVNSHPDVYDEPDAFKPERFLEKSKSGKGPRVFNNFTFGAGPRRCIGDRFSLMEQKTLLIKLLARYEVRPADCDSSFDNGSVPIVTMQPKEMRLEIRPLVR